MKNVTKISDLSGVSDRSIDTMAGFFNDRLLSILECSKDLLSAAYSLLVTQSLADLKNIYLIRNKVRNACERFQTN